MSPEQAGHLLASLQYADSQFPGGGFAFSWGLEGLAADGLLKRAELEAFLRGQLENRWLTFDRPFIEAAARACGDIDTLARLDADIDAMTAGELQRDGSARAGRALLGVHAKLGSAEAAAYRAHAEANALACHLPLATGVVLSASGLPPQNIAAIAAYTFLANLTTAAIRLGIASHLDSQRAIANLRPMVAAALAEPAPDPRHAYSFTPLADIAMMRHMTRELRLFSN